MSEITTFLDALVTLIQQAGIYSEKIYNKDDQTPLAAVLWPDIERQ